MEKKSYHNLEKTKFTNLMVGFCYVSGIVLATFSYGKTEEVERKYRTSQFDNSSFYVDMKETPKEIPQPKEQPQNIQSSQKNLTLDLNQDLKPVESNNPVEENPFVDLNLPKGDTNLIVQVDPIPNVAPEEVKDYPDSEAEFPGGYEQWKKYLLQELRYPDISIEMGEQGIVYVSFVIEIDGSVSDVRIIKGVSLHIDREAKRVIKNSPRWIPGKISKSSVRTRLSIPINFVIE